MKKRVLLVRQKDDEFKNIFINVYYYMYCIIILLYVYSRGITTSSRDVVQPTGSTWYADEQGKNGCTGSLKKEKTGPRLQTMVDGQQL